MRFLVDEDLPSEIARLIEQEGHQAVEVAATFRGVSDDEVWRIAGSEAMVLISRDTDFRLSREPRPIGLILLRPRKIDSKAALVKMFTDFVRQGGLDTATGKILILELGRRPRAGLLKDG